MVSATSAEFTWQFFIGNLEAGYMRLIFEILLTEFYSCFLLVKLDPNSHIHNI